MKPEEKEPTAEELVLGNTTDFTLPSGKSVTIREQNGDDDDLISNAHYAKNGSHLNHFISAIVISTDITPTKRLTPEDVMKMKVRDKYAILIKSRCFSIGKEVQFEYDWGSDNGGKVLYTEDLEQYIFDYANPEYPEIGHEDYFEYRIRPYLDGDASIRELELSSGKKVRYEYLNGVSEKYLLELPTIKMTKNAELKARNIHQESNGEWIKVQSFKFFNSTDMRELRDDVKMYDPDTTLISELENPKNEAIEFFPIILAPDFFFPGEI